MLFDQKERKTVRDCKLEWHCHEIKIYQSKLDNGYIFEGYGIIKSTDNGNLYLDFICKKTNKTLDVIDHIPEDSLDECQALKMEAITIDGIKLCSVGFRLELDFQMSFTEDPKLYKIGLSYLEFQEDTANTEITYKTKKSLYFEFNEECRVPKNKANKTESTLGTRSHSWNQTVLNYKDFEINIIRHDNFTEVTAHGNNLDLNKLKTALTFYLSFSSGVYIQPYFEYKREGFSSVTKIKSIDKKKINKNIPAPISDLVYDENRQSLEHLHFELFYNIYDVLITNENRFNSIYSHWKRIWHSFLSLEMSVPMLTISVAVEGLVNDIFIPKISSAMRNELFEQEKNDIISELQKVTLTTDHLKTLVNFVEKWGNVHAKKALSYLAEKNVIETQQVKIWSDLRNSSAHPKLMKQDERRKRMDINRTIICLGLYYRLSLNVFSYQGAQYAYDKPKSSKLICYEYINVLH